jgi:hypothetical protein
MLDRLDLITHSVSIPQGGFTLPKVVLVHRELKAKIFPTCGPATYVATLYMFFLVKKGTLLK